MANSTKTDPYASAINSFRQQRLAYLERSLALAPRARPLLVLPPHPDRVDFAKLLKVLQDLRLGLLTFLDLLPESFLPDQLSPLALMNTS